MWRYNLSEEGRSWMNLPKESTGDRYSDLGVYRDRILAAIKKLNRYLSPPEVSHETGIEKKTVDHMMQSCYTAGFMTRQWSLR